MRVSDLVPASQEAWLRWVTRKFSGVARLYLIYDDHKFGPDTAREIANEVLPEDFVPEEESFEILSNEQLRAEKQQGIIRPFGQTLGAEDHQWWIELYLDRDVWDLLVAEAPPQHAVQCRGMTADIPPKKAKKKG
jgi:hypothetical protein